MIYFLQRADGAIKIGSTPENLSPSQLVNRERSQLKLLAINPTNESKYLLHCIFADLWIDGDWFYPGDKLVLYIQTEAQRVTSQEMPLMTDNERAMINAFLGRLNKGQ